MRKAAVNIIFPYLYRYCVPCLWGIIDEGCVTDLLSCCCCGAPIEQTSEHTDTGRVLEGVGIVAIGPAAN